MRSFFHFCLVLLALYFGYVLVRALVRVVRREMGLPASEPRQEERLLRQALIGTLASTIVPLAFLRHGSVEGGALVLFIALPAFFGAMVLWVSGVKGIVGLYRREPRLLLHPTVFLCCVAASFSLSMGALVVARFVQHGLP